MGSSYAYPVLQTPDAREALAAVGGLLDLTDRRDLSLWVSVHTSDLEEIGRLRETYPAACWHSDSDTEWLEHDQGWPERRGDMAALLPMCMSVEDEGVDAVERLTAVVHPHTPVWLYWEIECWPPMPGRGRGSRYAGVQLTLNSRDFAIERLADDHMLYVAVGRWDVERAEWLAHRAGLTVVGEPSESL